MSRVILLTVIMCLSAIGISYAQNPNLEVHGNPYLGINTYAGATTNGELSLYIVQQYGVNMNLANWKLSVRLEVPIQANDGTLFPAEKISFIPARADGLGMAAIPTVAEIGMPSSVPLNSFSEIFLVPNGNVPLKNNNGYFQLKLHFILMAAGGAYLKDLYNKTGSWDKYYSAKFLFTLYDGNNNVIAMVKHTYGNLNVQKLSDTPPEENKYTIQVSTGASNGLLEFKTMADYINGKSVTYADGLSVSATTPFQVTVRSISSHFSSSTGNSLPIGIVRLQLSGYTGNMYLRSLSSAPLTILEGASTQGKPVNYNITYSTEANDSRLYNVPSEQYETSLMYEISPR